MTENPPEDTENQRLERTVQALRVWVGRIRRIPALLYMVMWASVASGLVVGLLWFVASEHVWIRWLAVPWLAFAAVPQVGQWILASSIRELIELPDTLLTLKSGLAEGSARALDTIRRRELEVREPKGFLGTLREAYAVHGDITKIMATRALLRRFTGGLAVVIGPVSFVANCLIIALAFISLAIAAP